MKKYYNAFNQIELIGPVRMRKIIKYFSNAKNAWFAPQHDFEKAGLEASVIDNLFRQKEKINPDKEMEKLSKENIRAFTINDPEYPDSLKQIYNPPFILYVKGDIEQTKSSIAIVGSRKVSNYGKQAAQTLARDLASAGITIVSGMALGIDTIAHSECLQTEQQTIAVLGSGLDNVSIYPAINKKLAERIISNGALISEYPIGSPPLKHHFPNRNRIISALSLGVLVIEAAKTSGSLITAKYALEQNKDVFAVPGSIFSENSAGTNDLIKSGAKPISSAQEILDELNLNAASAFIKTRKIIPENKEEEIILKYLSHDPIHIDKIAELTKLDTSALNCAMTIMEMKGKIKNLGAMMFVIG